MIRPSNPAPLIGLVGLAGSGKSALAGHLAAGHGYERRRFAAGLKAMTAAFLRAAGVPEAEVLGYVDGARKEEVVPGLGVTTRHVMQTVGTEWGRACIAPDVWTRIAMAGADAARARGVPVVLDDVRFPDEAEAVRAAGGVLVRVVRPGLEASAGAHVSEALSDGLPVDLTVVNDADRDGLARAADWLALR